MSVLRLDFRRPLTALEVRDPVIESFKETAKTNGIYATFHQPQQIAFSGHSGMRKSDRTRIGNGKHKSWHINFQVEPPQENKPTVIGRLFIVSPVRPEKMQFGGFDYGDFGKPKPTYDHATVHTPSELEHWKPIDPDPILLEMTLAGLHTQFEEMYPRLFPISQYVV